MSQKIYTAPKEVINAIMKEFEINDNFSQEETTWGVTKVQTGLVVFEIHDSIRKLIISELNQLENYEGKVTFNEKLDPIYEATIEADNVESYFLARILFIIRERKKNKKVNIKNATLTLIKMYMTKAAIKAKISPLGFIPEVEYVKDMWSIKASIDGKPIKASMQNPDLLCEWIGLQLKKLKPKSD